jgi:pimeloyl-ACP methyl ester carboxylesterase
LSVVPYLTRDDARIWWETQGDGEPVLLIMGLGYPSSMWYRVVPVLAENHTVITFDNRGAGLTGVPDGPYSIEQMADDAAAVLEAALAASADRARRSADAPTSAAVVGISLGGLIATEMTLRHPELVERLALVSTHPGGAKGVAPEPEVLEMLTARAKMSPIDAARVAIPVVYARDTDPKRIEEDIEVRMRRPTSREGYDNQLRAAFEYPGAFSRLGSIRIPVLVVHGTADRLVPVDNGRVLAGAIPDSSLELLDGAGHIVPTDRTEELNEILVRFLAPASDSTPSE